MLYISKREVPLFNQSDSDLHMAAFTFAPETRHLPAPYVIAGLLGASNFALLPIALEYVTRITYPASPEVSSTICWTISQLLGALFIIIMDALKLDESANPPFNMKRALIFQTILACIVVPLPLLVGIERFGLGSGKLSDEIVPLGGDSIH